MLNSVTVADLPVILFYRKVKGSQLSQMKFSYPYNLSNTTTNMYPSNTRTTRHFGTCTLLSSLILAFCCIANTWSPWRKGICWSKGVWLYYIKLYNTTLTSGIATPPRHHFTLPRCQKMWHSQKYCVLRYKLLFLPATHTRYCRSLRF